MKICKHCHKPRQALRSYGLCYVCYGTPAIRERHAPERELTDEELDAMIAQQRQQLPKWWNESVRKMDLLKGLS